MEQLRKTKNIVSVGDFLLDTSNLDLRNTNRSRHAVGDIPLVLCFALLGVYWLCAPTAFSPKEECCLSIGGKRLVPVVSLRPFSSPWTVTSLTELLQIMSFVIVITTHQATVLRTTSICYKIERCIFSRKLIYRCKKTVN